MNRLQAQLYAGRDPRELPAYEVTEAAHYLRLPFSTLQSWLRPVSFEGTNGRNTKALIERPAGSRRLSFFNLVEGHVLKALRHHYRVPAPEIRIAIQYAEDQLRVDRLLVSDELRTAGKQLFLERMGELINLGRGGQLALATLLESHLERIEYKKKMPFVLYPFIADGIDARLIQINPLVSFGKPIVKSRGISTYAIAERYELGESKKKIAKDYRITSNEVEEAILYEAAA